MSTGLDVFDASVQQTNLWLKDLMERLGVDRRHAYRALSATLHALRDQLGTVNAVHLGAQLPLLVRGFYYEGWHVTEKPPHLRHKQDFLDYVDGDVFRGLSLDPEEAVRAVFEVLANRLDPGEIEKVIKLLPTDMRDLWTRARHVTAKATDSSKL